MNFQCHFERPENADQRIGARSTLSDMDPLLWASAEHTHAILREDDGRSEGPQMDTIASVLVTKNNSAKV